MQNVDALLLGRKTYVIHANAFEPMKPGDPFRDLMNAPAKYVVSKTLQKPIWRDMTVIRDDVGEAVRNLKAAPGKSILTDGSHQLVHALLEHDLVDELHLLLYPLVLGGGKRLLPERVHTAFKFRRLLAGRLPARPSFLPHPRLARRPRAPYSTTAMTYAIETTGLVKHFGATRALNGVDLRIPRGSVYGLLGPNGAGKTTTIRILATLLEPTAGRATVLGHDVAREADVVRRNVSLTGQFASVDEDLSGQENLVLVGRLLGLSWRDAKRRASELLEAFGLAEAAGRQVQTYSGGERRRIDIAASLVAIPEILFLDEPTTGLDPRSRTQVWELVRRIAAEGTTVLLTTQYLDEADRLAERMAVIDHGRVIAEGTSRELKASVGSNALHLRLVDGRHRAEAQRLVTRVLGDGVLPISEPMEVAARLETAEQAAAVLMALSERGIGVAEFSVGNPSLDEVFLSLTGRPAETTPTEAKP
jgi:ABC-2 type transport system ATP-binding protein